jgi:hypothetical protein
MKIKIRAEMGKLFSTDISHEIWPPNGCRLVPIRGYPLVCRTRQRRFDGTSFELKKLLACTLPLRPGPDGTGQAQVKTRTPRSVSPTSLSKGRAARSDERSEYGVHALLGGIPS